MSATLGACLTMAPLLAVVDALLRPRRTVRALRAFAAAGVGGRHAGGVAALRDIWFARVARVALRGLMAAGLGGVVLARVVLVGNVAMLSRGAVLATCHSPWGRLLAAWMARDGRIAMLASRRWIARAGGAHEPADRRGMRRAIGRLRGGRCVAISIDHFAADGSCDATMLGRTVRARTGAARIAALARVPVVPVVARWAGGRLEVALGEAIPVSSGTVDEATVAALAALDRELRRDPSIWADALRFSSAAARGARGR